MRPKDGIKPKKYGLPFMIKFALFPFSTFFDETVSRSIVNEAFTYSPLRLFRRRRLNLSLTISKHSFASSN